MSYQLIAFFNDDFKDLKRPELMLWQNRSKRPRII